MRFASPFPTRQSPSGRLVRQGDTARKRPAQRGVMLIEVLVSILIFSFGILGTVALYARAVQYSTNAEDRSRAALLANEMATAMLLRGSNDVSVGLLRDDFEAWQLRAGDAAGSGLPSGAGVVSAPVDRRVTITITWTPTFSTTAQQFVTQVTI